MSIDCTIEQELGGVLRAARLDARQRQAVARRLGWDGKPPTTLSDAGTFSGYTRERVRQLEQRVRAHVARAQPALPATAAALATIHAAAPAGAGELERTLVHKRIAVGPFHPEGVLRAAELAGLRVTVVARNGTLLRSGQDSVSDITVQAARRLVVRDGATTPAAVAKSLGSPASEVLQLLELRDDVVWLGNERAWLLVPAARTRVTTALRKMLSVEPHLSLADARNGLERIRSHATLPADVVRFICSTSGGMSFDGRNDIVRATTRLDPARELSPLEHLLVGVFREEGPILEFSQITRLAELRGVKPGTSAVYLSRSAVFEQLSRARYALRGYQREVLPLRAAA